MGRYYHTLLERDDKQSPWRIEFGDYDRKVVAQERRDRQESWPFPRLVNLHIISTMDDQASIKARVDELNARLVRHDSA